MGRPELPLDAQVRAEKAQREEIQQRKQAEKKEEAKPLIDQVLSSVEKSIVGQSFETAAVVDKDGNTLLRKDGGKHSVEFTDEELKLFEGATLTHNHPRGSSLSRGDIKLATMYQLGSIRAVGWQGGKRYLYTAELSPKLHKKGWINIANEVVDNTERLILSEFNNKIRRGEVSREEANDAHHHELWTQVSKWLGDDFKYRREEW